jgi:phosphoglycolate phosphatase
MGDPTSHRPLWRGQALDAVLFDLDGTLLDTAGDISAALNRTLAEYGWAPAAENDVRRMIGRGSPMLIQRAAAAQGRVLDDATQKAMVERFFDHYGSLQVSNEFDAQPYPGASESLRRLHGAGLRTAVVTNKQRRFASGLLERLELSAWVDLVVGGDSCERRKPDPQPLLFACEYLQVLPSRALMVGDSINDVQAARSAGIPIVCVPYGYNEGQDPRALPCDALIDTLAELPAMLLSSAQSLSGMHILPSAR